MAILYRITRMPQVDETIRRYVQQLDSDERIQKFAAEWRQMEAT